MKFFNSKVALSCLLASVMCSPSTQAGLIGKTVDSVALVGTVAAAGALTYGAVTGQKEPGRNGLGYSKAIKSLSSLDAAPHAAAILGRTVLFDFTKGFKDLASLARRVINTSENVIEQYNKNVNGLGSENKTESTNNIKNTDSSNEISSK